MVVFIETGDFGGVVAPPKSPVSMNTTIGFQVLISKPIREYRHFIVPVSLNTVKKNKIKYVRVSTETLI